MDKKDQIKNEMQQADEKTLKRMLKRIAHRYFAVNRIHRVYDGEEIKIVSENGVKILDDEFAMLETFNDADCEVILKSRVFRKALESKKEIGDGIMVEKGEGIIPILKEEFEDVEISGKAWDLSKSLNILSRNIKAIINDCPAERMSIMSGGNGKFVWIQYARDWNAMIDGGVASGSIEDAPIHYNGVFFDDINYSKIAFAFIPVDDF